MSCDLLLSASLRRREQKWPKCGSAEKEKKYPDLSLLLPFDLLLVLSKDQIQLEAIEKGTWLMQSIEVGLPGYTSEWKRAESDYTSI